ncbi:MAG: hypothetical protein A2Z25_21260 [Planctomycetes bacterium RBG_16_55_9]|nr:MAG: hypothetical protein A2Z25_21260 [Planctomycetes bacterium RBG_16_55_9]
MAEYQAGLHKEVTTIFKGVWDPEIDNVEQSYAPSGTNNVAYHMGPPPRGRHREATEAPVHVFSLRSRREKKRLLSISRHLIINNSAD